jgi:ferrous iron transport protein A
LTKINYIDTSILLALANLNYLMRLMKKSLKNLKPNEKARIIEINAQDSFKKKILDMGIIKGSHVEFIRTAPLGDPIEIKIKGYYLSLRKDEIKDILVEII